MGFESGKASPCIFHCGKRKLKTYVHGDDFVTTGLVEELIWLKGKLGAKYNISTTILGEDKELEKRVQVLNRTLEWIPGEGITLEADQRHAQVIIEETGSSNKSPLKIPATKVLAEEKEDLKASEAKEARKKGKKAEEKRDKLEGKAATKFRALVARANYLQMDRPDISYSTKELARNMSEQGLEDWKGLERLGRYLKGRPRARQWFRFQRQPQ